MGLYSAGHYVFLTVAALVGVVLALANGSSGGAIVMGALAIIAGLTALAKRWR